LYAAETWILRKGDYKYLESFEILRWKRMEKIIWTDHVRNEEMLQRVKEESFVSFRFASFRFVALPSSTYSH
jgi:hypothetical protein